MFFQTYKSIKFAKTLSLVYDHEKGHLYYCHMQEKAAIELQDHGIIARSFATDCTFLPVWKCNFSHFSAIRVCISHDPQKDPKGQIGKIVAQQKSLYVMAISMECYTLIPGIAKFACS